MFSLAEYKDDSYIIPRSSSVIAKRVPAVKPGKGRGAMYLAGTASTAPNSSESSYARDSKPTTGNTMKTRIGSSAMSVRFDGKDEPYENRAPVRVDTQYKYENSVQLQFPSKTPKPFESDEAAAMAAMFKAQTDVWEETQEKMLQSVLFLTTCFYCLVVTDVVCFCGTTQCSVLSPFTTT